MVQGRLNNALCLHDWFVCGPTVTAACWETLQLHSWQAPTPCATSLDAMRQQQAKSNDDPSGFWLTEKAGL